MKDLTDLMKEVFELKDELISIRRDIHEHPELSFKEFRTTELIVDYLKNLGIEVSRPTPTGAVGVIRGSGEGRTIALRADIDALPIKEETGLPFASRNEGIMHACGHDAHTAMLLVAAKILQANSDSFRGTVKLLFQPAEEKAGGALQMIEAGALENPRPEAIMGIHVWPYSESGTIGYTRGPAMASSDFFNVEIVGKGGHGAYPHITIDPVNALVHTVSALNSLVGRVVDPLDSLVLSVTTIHAGTAGNIVPERASFGGTVRALNEDTREKIEQLVKEISKKVPESFGATSTIEYKRTTKVVVNSSKFVDFIISTMDEAGIFDKREELPPTMGSEDFSFFLERVPFGAFMRLGVKNENLDAVYSLHSPKFVIDEDALPYGTALHVAVAFKFLTEG